MDTLVCFSQYFANKQNARSYGNILKPKIFKEDGLFLQHLLKDISLVSALPKDFINILQTLKDNLRNKSKEDFKDCFSENCDKNIFLESVKKNYIFDGCWKALMQIIPKAFFGRNHNLKIFRKLMQIVVHSMKSQHINLSKTVYKWDLTSHPWETLPEALSQKILHKLLLWISEYILSPIIYLNFYVTTCKLDQDEYKLHFFWKFQWQSFYDKKLSDMAFAKVIKRFHSYCLGKKSRRNHNLSERMKLKAMSKDIPKLYLVLKPNKDCRPIVRYKSSSNTIEKYKMKDRLNFLRMITGKPQEKLETLYFNTYKQWLNLNKPKLYFVKTDLSNAFGSINREKLVKILSLRHLNFQKSEKNLTLKKKIAQEYKNMMSELRNPLLVRAGSTIYEWKEGLVQGYKYSPALSELFYTHMDETYFSHHQKITDSRVTLFIRVVDDYLYVTDSLDDAHSFLTALSNYRNVNYSKTVVNFQHPSIQFSNQINFLGYAYDTSTLQVSKASNMYTGQMCFKIAFTSAVSNISKFLENRIGKSGIQINGHIFNLYYNEEIIWKHVFTIFCLSANKFCTILAILCHQEDMMKYLNLYKRVSVKLCNAIIETLMKNKPRNTVIVYCINHFRYLSVFALLLCAKGVKKCNGLVPIIKDDLAKTNCIFGKWREHASRIDENGELKTPAVKEICRRSDLRAIIRKFDTLPVGFQCHNHYFNKL